MPAVTVLGEMEFYLLFADILRPDVVIAHDGYNDFRVSQFTDPYFLDNFGITYGPVEVTDWAKELQYYPEKVPDALHPGQYEIINRDRDVIVDSYYSRLVQLKSIVERTGASFVSGLQPQVGSKNGMCKREKDFLDESPNARDGRFDNVEIMYDLYVQRYVLPMESETEDDEPWIIDFHTAFQKFGPDECIFFDSVHPNQTGNRAIAEIYHSRLRDLLTTLSTK
jgi:hypothetical protein